MPDDLKETILEATRKKLKELLGNLCKTLEEEEPLARSTMSTQNKNCPDILGAIDSLIYVMKEHKCLVDLDLDQDSLGKLHNLATILDKIEENPEISKLFTTKHHDKFKELAREIRKKIEEKIEQPAPPPQAPPILISKISNSEETPPQKENNNQKEQKENNNQKKQTDYTPP